MFMFKYRLRKHKITELEWKTNTEISLTTKVFFICVIIVCSIKCYENITIIMLYTIYLDSRKCLVLNTKTSPRFTVLNVSKQTF